MLRSALLGVGHYVPTKVVTNDDLAKLMPTSDEWIQQRTGIRERRFIEQDGIGASDLAGPAAKRAGGRAGRPRAGVGCAQRARRGGARGGGGPWQRSTGPSPQPGARL